MWRGELGSEVIFFRRRAVLLSSACRQAVYSTLTPEAMWSVPAEVLFPAVATAQLQPTRPSGEACS